jgi:hypothetical protein
LYAVRIRKRLVADEEFIISLKKSLCIADTIRPPKGALRSKLFWSATYDSHKKS